MQQYKQGKDGGGNPVFNNPPFSLGDSDAADEQDPCPEHHAAIYYFAGVVIRQCRIDFNKVFRPTPLAFILWPFILCREDLYDWGNMAVAFSCWCCISALMWLNQYYKSQMIGKSTLLYIGKNTLPIYLFHPIFTMAAKFYHPLFAFDKSEILLAAFTIILAIAGSIAIAKVMEKTKLAYFFGKKEILR